MTACGSGQCHRSRCQRLDLPILLSDVRLAEREWLVCPLAPGADAICVMRACRIPRLALRAEFDRLVAHFCGLTEEVRPHPHFLPGGPRAGQTSGISGVARRQQGRVR